MSSQLQPLLGSRASKEVSDPCLDVRAGVEDGSSVGNLDEVVSVGDVGQISEAEEIASQVLALGQSLLVHIQNSLELGHLLGHDTMVAGQAELGIEEQIVDDFRDC